MVVQHNLQAMNANRMLGITTGQVSSSTEKLSSGYKINRAADDAAGLAISEKMRKQIRGLDQASSNSEDGISCVQTAEGALSEVTDMLQRMNELCVQAANGTNSETDRQYIQDEIDQLVTEIDRVSETTKFNEIYLLKGSEEKTPIATYMTNYTISYTRYSKGDNVYGSLPPYHINYTGTNNVYMVSNDIFTSQSASAQKIQNGDDMTEYFVYNDTDWNGLNGNSANVVFNTEDYAAFVNITLNTKVMEGEDGTVYGELASTDEDDRLTYDLSTNGNDNIVRASRTLYVYDTETSVMHRITAGTDMSEYLNDDNSLKDQYRLVDVMTADVQYVDGYDATTMPTQSTKRYAGTSGIVYCVDEDDPTIITEKYLNYGDNVSDLYYENDDYSWGYVDNGKEEEFTEALLKHLTYGGDLDSSWLWYEEDSVTREPFIGYYDSTNGHQYSVDLAGKLHRLRSTTYDQALMGELVTLTAASIYTEADLTSTQVTGKRVMWESGVSLEWDDSLVEIDMSYQKLYDADGNEVSAIRLNEFFDDKGIYQGGLFTTSQATVEDEVFASEDSEGYQELLAAGYQPAVITEFIQQSITWVNDELDISIQAGAESDRANKIGISLPSFASANLGINKLYSSNIGIVDTTGDKATDAIDVLADALQILSTQRSYLGAIQNRIEHTIKNLDNIVENTTAAESQIRDTDMAEEMVTYSNNNILQQAGQSMLAQANQSNQGVLSLLQ